METNVTAKSKKVWTKPRIMETASIGTAQAGKTVRLTEATIVIGGLLVAVGPAS